MTCRMTGPINTQAGGVISSNCRAYILTCLSTENPGVLHLASPCADAFDHLMSMLGQPFHTIRICRLPSTS